MKRQIMLLVGAGLLVGLVGAQEQKKPTTQITPAPPVGLSTAPAFVPVADDIKLQVRNLQYQQDQLEIEKVNLQLRVEELKAKEATLFDQEKLLVYKYAVAHNIDLTDNELDPTEVRFIKKHKP